MTKERQSKLSKEQDKLPWSELARHHAFGRLMLVKAPLDLLEVAGAVASDNSTKVKAWMEQSIFGPPSDEEALGFASDNEQEFLVNIVSPFILVQELSN